MSVCRYTAQRMQTNSEWSTTFRFTIDNPPVPQSLATWTLIGKCQRVNLPNTYLDLIPRMNIGDDDTSQLIISLSKDDTLMLGVGRIVFEVLRVDPIPQRPILKFFIDNFNGVMDG